MDPDHLRRLSGEERRKERRDGIRLARIATIVACAAFAVAGALALVGGIVDPGAWGWRGGGTGILAGSLCLAFFGPGTVLLIVKEVRRRRRERGERE